MVSRSRVAKLMALALAAAAPATTGLAGSFTFSYGGRLADANDVAIAGPVSLTLKFYSSANGGSAIPVSPVTFTNVPLDDGVFQVDVTQLLPAELNTVFAGSGDTWVEVTDTTHGVTYPRQHMTAIPFALKVPVDGKTISFDANGNLTLVAGAPTAPGQTLVSDGSGGLTWGSAPSSSVSGANITGSIPPTVLTSVPAASVTGTLAATARVPATTIVGTLAAAQIPTMVGDTGSGGAAGLVPAPGIGSTSAGKFLRADGQWAVPSVAGGNATALQNVAVSSTSPSSGQVMTYTGGVWQPSTPASTNNATSLQGVGVASTSPAAGQTLTFNGSAWTPRNYVSTASVGIGTPSAAYPLQIVSSLSASSGSATGAQIAPALNATANNDTLTALTINASFLDNSHTGVAHNSLIVSGGNVGLGIAAANTQLDMAGAFSLRGVSSQPVSPGGQGRLYFDASSGHFMVSENSGAYQPLVGGGGGTASVASGGTGATSFTANGVIIGGGAGPLSATAAGSNGQVLTVIAGQPQFGPLNLAQAGAFTGTLSAVSLPVMGASGAGHAAGIVPDPGASAGTTKFLREDGTWASPSGSSLAAPGPIGATTPSTGAFTAVGIGTSSATTVLDVAGAFTQRSMSAPAVAPAGQGRIYFDTTSNQFMVSQNGGAYAPLGTVTGGTITQISSGAGLTGGGTSGNVTVGLAPVGTAGTYAKVATDAYGRVTGGASLGAADLPAIPASQISGTLASAQIATIPTTQISGTLAPSQVPAIPATQIAGTLAPSQIAAIPASQITGTLVPAQVQAAGPTFGIQYNAGGGALAGSPNLTWDNTNQRFGVGTANPNAVIGAVGATSIPTIVAEQDSNDTISPNLTFRKSTGSPGAPAPALNSKLGQIAFQGYDGSAFATGSQIVAYSTETTWSGTGHGSSLGFLTTAFGTTAVNERMRITDYGPIGINTAVPNAQLEIDNSVTYQPGLLVKGFAGQTANLAEFRQSGGQLSMEINATGQVGIGSGSPAFQLDINSGSIQQGLQVASTAIQTTLQLNNLAGGRSFDLMSTGGGSGFGAGKLVLADQTAGGLARLTVDMNGQVGVGTTSPGATLDVMGSVRSSGAFIFGDGTSQATAAAQTIAGGCDANGPWAAPGFGPPTGCNNTGTCLASSVTVSGIPTVSCTGGATWHGVVQPLPGFFLSGCTGNWSGTGAFYVKYINVGICVK